MTFNPDSFPLNWIVPPVNGLPQYPVKGPAAGIRRMVVRKMYAQTVFPHLIGRPYSPDDHWVSSVTRWLKHLRVFHSTAKTDGDTRSQGLATRMLNCSPSGYNLADPGTSPWRYCRKIFCLFCYARAVSTRYPLLRHAVKTSPRGVDYWLAAYKCVGGRRLLCGRLRKLMVAGAVSVSVPIPAGGPDAGKWLHRAVLITDNRSRLRGLKAYRNLKVHKTARLVGSVLGYPNVWRAREGLLGVRAAISAIPAAEKRGNQAAVFLGSYGVCRSDPRYDPKRSALGFFTPPPQE